MCQTPLLAEKHGEQKPPREFSQRRLLGGTPLGLGASHLEKLRVIDPAGQAVSQARQPVTEIHLVGERFLGLELAVGDGAHEGDAPARAVALELRLHVGRARRQAHAAVHALLDDRVVEILEVARRGSTDIENNLHKSLMSKLRRDERRAWWLQTDLLPTTLLRCLVPEDRRIRIMIQFSGGNGIELKIFWSSNWSQEFGAGPFPVSSSRKRLEEMCRHFVQW